MTTARPRLGVFKLTSCDGCQLTLLDLEDELGLELSTRDEDTIAGVVLSELGRKPRVGDRVVLGPAQLEVLEVQGNRIRSLGLELAPGQPSATP